MTQSNDSLHHDDIARVARAIWEAEGRPDGCDHDHWTRARRILEEERGADLPKAEASGAHDAAPEPPASGDARPVQPGFEDVPPGIVPGMKAQDAEESREKPAGRFAQQLADLPDESPAPRSSDEPSPT